MITPEYIRLMPKNSDLHIFSRIDADYWLSEDGWRVKDAVTETLDPQGRYALKINGHYYPVIEIDDEGGPPIYSCWAFSAPEIHVEIPANDWFDLDGE